MNESAKINIGKVAALKKLREKVSELSDVMKELGEPILDDLALLPAIYEAYKRVFQRRGCPDEATSVRNRKKFLMVVLYLYSPKALAGDRMRMGLRKQAPQYPTTARVLSCNITLTRISDATLTLFSKRFWILLMINLLLLTK